MSKQSKRMHQVLAAALACALILVNIPLGVYAANPYLPLWEYIPDGEPYVFEDPDNPGEHRVYIYGSHDQRKTDYCGWDLVAWSAPVDDLNNWRYDGVIFQSVVNGTPDVLFAPDVAEVVDRETGEKTYYLYPNNQSWGRNSQVARSDRPDGPFEVINWNPGNPTSTVGPLGFDPAVFVDDDGRVYGYWGFQRAYAAELDPETMYSVKPGAQIIEDFIPANDNTYRFYEASSLRKVGDTYVFVYSRVGHGDEPTGHNYNQLAYAWSTESPLGPWTYGGIIVDAGGEVLDPVVSERSFPGGNTHGSICEINGQWYVFYHRNLHAYARQAMVEPVDVVRNADGSVEISMAEVTSQGFELDGLDPYQKHSAGIACYLTSNWPNATIRPLYSQNVTSLPIVQLRNGAMAGIKYFNFDRTAPEGKHTQLELELVPLGVDAAIDVYLRAPEAANTKPTEVDGKLVWSGGSHHIGTVSLTADMPRMLTTVKLPVPGVDEVDGKWGVFFHFRGGPANTDLCEFHNLQFVVEESYFEDRFENGLTYWTASQAGESSVTVEDEQLRLAGPGAAAINKLGLKWSDYSFETQVADLQGTLQLRLRQSDARNYYELELSPDRQVLSSSLYGVKTVLASADHPVGAGPFKVEVDAVGQTLSVRVNGALLLSAANGDHEIGTVGYVTAGDGATAIDAMAVRRSTFTPPPPEEGGQGQRVDSILLDGAPLAGYADDIQTYLVPVEPGAGVPVVEARSTDAAVVVSVAQADAVPGTAVVRFVEDGAARGHSIRFYVQEGDGTISLGGLDALPEEWEYANASDSARAKVSFDEKGIVLSADVSGDYPGSGYPAIQLVEPLQGDWQLDAKVSANMELNASNMNGTNYESYGLALRADSGNWVKYVVQNRGNNQMVQMAGTAMGESNANQAGTTVYLRLVKSGNTLTGYRSGDGVNYVANTSTRLTDDYDGARMQFYASRTFGNTNFTAWLESISIISLEALEEVGADQLAVEQAAALIGGRVLLPQGDYADGQALADKAVETINALAEIARLEVEVAVAPSADGFSLAISKGAAATRVEPFSVVVLTADYDGLAALIEQARSLSEHDYTLASWNKLQSALNAALLVGEDADAQEIISAHGRLQAALQAMVRIDNTGDVIRVEGVDDGGYTNAAQVAVEVSEEVGISLDSLSVLLDGELVAVVVNESAQRAGLRAAVPSVMMTRQANGVYRTTLDLTAYGEGAYRLVADVVGNKYSFSFVSDRTPPEIDYNEETGAVTVTDRNLESVWLDGAQSEASFVLTEAGVYEVRAVDKAGNESTATLEVEHGGEPVDAESIKITGARTVRKNRSTQLTLVVEPEGAVAKGVTWEVLEEGMAEIDQNGLLTGRITGHCFVQATTEDGLIAQFIMQITP